MIIGRDRELDELAELLRHSSRQVITIVGAGGAGKSTLALELAARVSPHFRDGAAFVPLQSLDDPRRLVSEMARALGLVDAPGAHPIDRLVWGLRGQQLLLVLDNFEHLVDAANVVGEISARCREIGVLVTSRRRLNLPTERVMELGGLELPSAGAVIDRSCAAVRLFVERALAVDPALAEDQLDLDDVAALCRMVDGLPLAIELVASRTRTTPIGELTETLRSDRGLGALDDTIAWSHQLLDEVPAALLPRLAVFHDGFSLDALIEVCDPTDQFGADALIDALVSLIDLHLVESRSQADGTLRFNLLETVRRFALGRLQRSDLEPALRNAHAQHYVTVADRLSAELETSRRPTASVEIAREMPNLRAAMSHLEVTERWEQGLTLAADLGLYWLDNAPAREGRDWIRRFLPGVEPSSAAFAYGDGWDVRLSSYSALVRADDADPDDSWIAGLAERALAAHRTLMEAGDLRRGLRAAEHYVHLLGLSGRTDEASAFVAPLVEAPSTREARWLAADLLYVWAGALRDNGAPFDRTLAVLERTADVAGATRNERVLTRAMVSIAVFAARSSPGEARRQLEPVYEMALQSGDARGAAMVCSTSALLATTDGDLAGSAMWCGRALEIGRRIGWGDTLMRGVIGVMWLAERSGRHVDAARLYGGFRQLEHQLEHRTPPHLIEGFRSIVARLRQAMGERFDEVCEAGAMAGWEAAIELAMAVAAELSTAEPERPVRRRGPRANLELTERELDVLAQLVAGRTNAQIGDELAISPKTVMHHTMSVYRKLAVRGRAEAVAHAVKAGLVEV